MESLIRTISPDDEMYDSEHPDAYFETGNSAIHCIRLAMNAVGKETVSNILDFPCGHGGSCAASPPPFLTPS